MVSGPRRPGCAIWSSVPDGSRSSGRRRGLREEGVPPRHDQGGGAGGWRLQGTIYNDFEDKDAILQAIRQIE